MARLVVVSNRVGIPDGGARAGGLEVAIRPALRKRGGVWFGWSGKVADEDPGPAKTVERGDISYVTIDLRKDDYDEFYNGFANRVLWPILHYRLDLAEFTRRDLGGYFRVNEFFARNLENILRPDDVVWVHDYHLIPLAKTLRERGHKNKVGFFIHIPFPPPEILTRAAQSHERLIPALGHYDLVGFQTEVDANNFSRYLANEVGLARIDAETFDVDGRAVRVGVFPVGVETEAFQRLARARPRIGLRARRARQPGGARDDHRRRPARLQQGHSGADERVRALPHHFSGMARQRHVFADHAAQPHQHSGIFRHRAHGRGGGRAHQRQFRRSVVDAAALHQ